MLQKELEFLLHKVREQSSGFAIDFWDPYYWESDFEFEFNRTNAFRLLKKNAAKYHFKLSLDQDNEKY